MDHGSDIPLSSHNALRDSVTEGAPFPRAMRAATADEVAQLKRFLADPVTEDALDEQNVDPAVETAYLVVLSDYATGGPGYSGRVLIAVYDSGPHHVETYTWDYDGRLRRASRPVSHQEWI